MILRLRLRKENAPKSGYIRPYNMLVYTMYMYIIQTLTPTPQHRCLCSVEDLICIVCIYSE